MKFSEKIIKLRKQNGLSQEEFADMINVSRQAIYKWETEQSSPDVKNVQEISQKFNISIEYLLNDNLNEEAIQKNSNKTKKNLIKIFLKIIACLLIFYLLTVILKFCLLSRIMWKSSKYEFGNAIKRVSEKVYYNNLKHESFDCADITVYSINNKYLRFFNTNQFIDYSDSEKNIEYSLELNDKNKYTYIDNRTDKIYSTSDKEEQTKGTDLMPENFWEMLELSANPLSFITANKIYNISISNHSYTFHQFNEYTGQLEILETKSTSDNITYYDKYSLDSWNQSSEDEFFEFACDDHNVDYNMLKLYIEKQNSFNLKSKS